MLNYFTYTVDTIIVLGHEKLNIEMTRIFSSAAPTPVPGSEVGAQLPKVNVIKLPKSGGVVEVDDTYKARLRALQVRCYFYGGTQVKATTAQGLPAPVLPGHADPLGGVPSLSPFSTTIPFDLLEIYRVGQEAMAPSSALPIGASRTVTETQLVKLDPTNSTADQAALLNSVLALVQPPRGGGGAGQPDSSTNPTDDEIIGAPILGFIHVYVPSHLHPCSDQTARLYSPDVLHPAPTLTTRARRSQSSRPALADYQAKLPSSA